MIRRLLADRTGNISVLAAGCITGAMVLVGAAVDYARASTVKIALQAAVDSTAIMLAQTLNTTPTDQLQAKATTFLQAAFYKSNAGEASVTVDTSQISQKLIAVRATTIMPTTLTQLVGFASLNIGASAQAIAPQSYRHRIAMVLDNSGSMDEKNKMKALQSATTRFLAALSDQVSDPADIYVSIIPFNDGVNIDDSYASSWWVDWTDWNNNFDMFGKKGGRSSSSNHSSWKGCVSDRGNSLMPSSFAYDTNVVPQSVGTRPLTSLPITPKTAPKRLCR